MGAGRPPQRPGGRPVVIGSRFSEAEAAVVDAIRGQLKRAEYIRYLVAQDARAKGTKLP